MKCYTMNYTLYEGCANLNDYYLFVSDYESKAFNTYKIANADRAMRFLRLMEKKCGKVAALEMNRYDNKICRKELSVYNK